MVLQTKKLKITSELVGKRLDSIIAESLEGVSRSHVQKLFLKECVTVNGKVCVQKKYKANIDDIVVVNLPEPTKLEVKEEDIPIQIIYEDEDVIVVNKPVGMVVHPAPGNYEGTLVNAILHHCGESLSSINGVIRPGIVHRIDKDTSGLLMIAKNDNAHMELSKQLAAHSLTREYLAIVENNIKEDEGTIDLPIGRDPKNRLKRCVYGSGEKDAITHYRVLERFGNYTLVSCKLETGRTHQIRVHMAHIKHPLVGDLTYGSKKQKFKVKGQMLHAGKLGFIHPSQNEYMEFEIEPPKEFMKILGILREGK